ncbi:hypothetical protein M5689_001711 [Euphorbia peplus]|nr:hypothetical protein M5689_001711 [Euphorbia peplus]
MASSSSSNSLNSIVSQEEFNTFHNIDRMLYTRLVVTLDRDTAESTQVMGLWIWLERAGHVHDLVGKMLSLPDALINSMAEEALLCLKCIQNEHLLHLPNIPLLNNISRTGLSLIFFHENRLTILRSVSRILDQVCSRAFQDISAQVATMKAVKAKGKAPFSAPFENDFYGQMMNNSHNNVLPLVYGNNFIGSSSSGSQSQYGGGLFGNFMHVYDIALQKQILSNEIGDMLSRIQICTIDEEENVPADDRTIFLTFSKGYPISEQEIRDFFSRKYGECIEAIYMQEVTIEEHQPLYARLVVRSGAIIKTILDGNSKAKFSINGKHVWARKYVRKNLKSPPRSSSPSSNPTSPSAP